MDWQSVPFDQIQLTASQYHILNQLADITWYSHSSSTKPIVKEVIEFLPHGSIERQQLVHSTLTVFEMRAFRKYTFGGVHRLIAFMLASQDDPSRQHQWHKISQSNLASESFNNVTMILCTWLLSSGLNKLPSRSSPLASRLSASSWKLYLVLYVLQT